MQCQLCKKYDHIDTNYWDKLKQQKNMRERTSKLISNFF